MKDAIKVSVIIPNYNHQDFLEQRIQSVLNQTYQNFELILLDDASNDESQIILNSYSSHSKVSHCIVSDKNSGSVFRQWVKGIQLSKGKYVWIAESDDYADAHFLETTVQYMESNENLGMVFTDTMKVDKFENEMGLVSKSKKRLSDLAAQGGVINTLNFGKYLLEKMLIVNASSVLFRKNALLEVDFKVLQEFINTGDVFSYIGIALNHDILFINKPLNYMRLHAQSTTKKNKKNGTIYRDKLLMIDYYLKDFKRIQMDAKYIFNFLFGILFLSLDYGHKNLLNQVLKKFELHGFLKSKNYNSIKFIVSVYSQLPTRTMPHKVREKFKHLLKKHL